MPKHDNVKALTSWKHDIVRPWRNGQKMHPPTSNHASTTNAYIILHNTRTCTCMHTTCTKEEEEKRKKREASDRRHY